jgi:vancomycin resistance protein YoaR
MTDDFQPASRHRPRAGLRFLVAFLAGGARRNHFYYIDRYPIGLDATVFQSTGYAQDMTWTNDTKYPVLVRGINTRNGGTGYVRFDLSTVPNGRRVQISRPTIRNVRPAGDTVQYTSSLPAGSAQRVEFPVDGKDVWVTVTRIDHGKVLDRRVYYSHYARITGLTLIGRGGGA